MASHEWRVACASDSGPSHETCKCRTVLSRLLVSYHHSLVPRPNLMSGGRDSYHHCSCCLQCDNHAASNKGVISRVPSLPSPPVLDHLQYTKTESWATASNHKQGLEMRGEAGKYCYSSFVTSTNHIRLSHVVLQQVTKIVCPHVVTCPVECRIPNLPALPAICFARDELIAPFCL